MHPAKKLRHEPAADQIFVKKALDTERMFCYTHGSPIFRTYVSYISFTLITGRAETRLHMHVGVFQSAPAGRGGTSNGSKKPRDAQHHRSRRVAAITHADHASGNLVALGGVYCDSAAGAAGDLCDYG